MVDPDVQDKKNNTKKNKKKQQQNNQNKTLPQLVVKRFRRETKRFCALLSSASTCCHWKGAEQIASERGQRGIAEACGSDNWWKVSVSVTCCWAMTLGLMRRRKVCEKHARWQRVEGCGETEVIFTSRPPSSTVGFNRLRSAPCQRKHFASALCTLAQRRSALLPDSPMATAM